MSLKSLTLSSRDDSAVDAYWPKIGETEFVISKDSVFWPYKRLSTSSENSWPSWSLQRERGPFAMLIPVGKPANWLMHSADVHTFVAYKRDA